MYVAKNPGMVLFQKYGRTVCVNSPAEALLGSVAAATRHLGMAQGKTNVKNMIQNQTRRPLWLCHKQIQVTDARGAEK
jgi:hypothetical protein